MRPFSLVLGPKWEAEAYLVKSGLTYTIIRPGGLVDSDADLKTVGGRRNPVLANATLRGDGGFSPLLGGRIHREDVAEALVKSLWSPATHNRIFDMLDRSTLKPQDFLKIVRNLFTQVETGDAEAVSA